MDIYKTPESNVLTVEARRIQLKDNFGGWLYFFALINGLEVLICSILLLLFIVAFGASILPLDEAPALLSAIDIESLQYIPGGIFSFFVLMRLRESSKATPSSIRSLLGMDLLTKFIIGMAIIIANSNEWISFKPTPIFGSLIYYWVWSSYFKKSKRVLACYGVNAK